MDGSEVKNPLSINLGRQTRLLLSTVPHEPFVQALQNVSSRSELLATLSSLLFAPSLTLIIAEVFRPILFDLCSRWLLNDQNSDQKFIALCLLLDPHQELFPVLSAFLRKAYHVHGPLSYILSSAIDSADAQHLHHLLLAYYRILHANRKLPNALLWPLLPLTRLIRAPHPDTGVRFLAIRCYALQCGMGEAERVKLEKQVIGDVTEVDCPISYCVNVDGSVSLLDGWVFPAFEAKRILDARNAIVQSGLDYYLEENDEFEPIPTEELSPFTVNVHGIFLLRNQLLSAASSQLVMTQHVVHSLQQLALHISLRFPVLITSAPSSGKSLLLSYLAGILYPGVKNQIITIHLADTSLDPRSLLGSYVSSSTKPGTFEWKEGTVVQAMKQGKWVLFKDIDRATNEVLGVLKPLVESLGAGQWIGGCASMEVPGQGRIEASEHFAIFATRSIPARDGRYSKPTFLSAHKLHEIIHPTPTRDELQVIIDFKFPVLTRAPAHAAIRLWECVCAIEVTESTSARAVGIRELEKFCARLERLLPHNTGIGSMLGREIKLSDIVSNPTLREEIYLEARDVFFGSGTLTAAARLHTERVAFIVGDHLDLTVERQSWLLHNRIPELDIEKDINGKIVALRICRNRMASMPVMEVVSSPSRPFAMHRPAVSLLSRLSNAIVLGEPVLLTGETGTGKTSIVTHLASLLRKPLISLNLSNQTESSDLLGGFKPIDARVPGSELQAKFIQLFGGTFSRKKNAKFEESVRKAVLENKWKRAVVLWVEAIKLAKSRILSRDAEMDPVDDHRENAQTTPRKRRKVDSVQSQSADVTEADWLSFERDVVVFDVQHVQEKWKFAFAFVEGPLIKALRSGDWILLDEINLASPETLECITWLLQSSTSSITLTEQGSLEPVPRHPDFRMFACMNPATDVGKKDLPPNIRSRFTEIDVAPPDADRDTLMSIVEKYIGHCAVGEKGVIMDIVEFYMAVKQLSEERRIVDGSNHRPHYSIRTLARALMWAADMVSMYNLRRALWEGFLMAFTMVLDSTSAELVIALIRRHILAGVRNVGSLLSREPVIPSPSERFVKFGPFYLEKGTLDLNPVDDYILTPSVEKKLINLARIIVTRRFPILIEGPTSSGKTSSIEYLAKATGHRFVRINNHEHTDIQEYLGTYVSDPVTGKLVYKDGLLVRALRNGDWIVLDELNLAPTDVLEALNRLLDDNRELVIPETQEVIRPHPHFLLFASQNPPGLYAGRKVLSRAFRSRFLEVHFEDVPQGELETILCQRCRIAPSYAQKIVCVFQELQKRRQFGRVFDSKHGFATLRDLFRWAERDAIGYQQLAENGYMLLAERTRNRDDKEVVKEVIESTMKVRIDENTLYDITNPQVDSISVLGFPVPSSTQLVWTRAMKRLFVLVARALRFHEPVLLVGETGSGKTSVCQVYAEAVSSIITTVNCHQNTETADLIGGLRPVRNRASLEADAVREATAVLEQLGILDIPSDPEQLASSMDSILKSSAHSSSQARVLEDIRTNLRGSSAMFEWHDGPLVRAMRNGEMFLLDEISLADDSVLERLNSVLEPARTIVLAERGGGNVDSGHIQAEQGFMLVATMNPGGDYGKKELSPALRNRFTEIWVPAVEDRLDLEKIVDNLWSHDEMRSYTKPLLDFVEWLSNQASDRSLVALRDILAWVTFSNSMYRPGEYTTMPLRDIFHHAASMTYLDGLGAFSQFSAYSSDALSRLKASALLFIKQLIPLESDILDAIEIRDQTDIIQIGSFPLPKGSHAPMLHLYNIRAPTTLHNAMRIVRACQVSKPVLLEGSPGVGKTSLISALADLSGHHLARINLSDQTDLIDLFGTDLPVEGGRPGEFAWRDAEFLKALQEGHWVLLDEMNLAPQAILEGLNSVLDHRGSVYIPELGRSFHKHPDFRIFAAQNPLHQGGGRKGLPKSFLNRFTKVYLEELSPYDLLLVCCHLFPDYPVDLLRDMITFNTHLNEEVVHKRSFGREGSPWEFNLRDVIRWGTLLQARTRTSKPFEYLQAIYLQRFRTESDRERVVQLFNETFQTPVDYIKNVPRPSISASYVQIGSFLSCRRNFIGNERSAPILQSQLNSVEAVGACLSNNWLVILTGFRESGKTNLVRCIASITGNVLHEVSIHNATDITDILGSFEQNDYRIQVLQLVKEVSSLFETLSRSIQYLYLQETAEYHALQTLITSPVLDDVPVLLSTLQTVLHGLPQTIEARTGLLHKTHTLITSFDSTGRFEWVDGPLVRALRHGHWILLDGANLCNPSVLDRLNSLCESGGVLTLSERGHTNGVVEVINPHPNFRLFMALDAAHGELSRAMRNRGVEIALKHSRTPEDQKMCSEYQRLPVFAASTTGLTSAQFALWRRGLLTGTISTLSSWPASALFAEDSVCRSLADYADPLISSSQSPKSEDSVLFFAVQSVPPAYLMYFVRFLHALGPSYSRLSRLQKVLRTIGNQQVSSFFSRLRDKSSQIQGVPSDFLTVQPMEFFLNSLPCYALHNETSNSSQHEQNIRMLNLYVDTYIGDEVQPELERKVSAKDNAILMISSRRQLLIPQAILDVKALLDAIQATAKSLIEKMSFDASGTMHQEDIPLASQLLHYGHYLWQIAQNQPFDFSSVQVISRWILDALISASSVFEKSVHCAKKMEELVALSSGLGFHDIWSAFHSESSLSLWNESSYKLEEFASSCKDPSSIFGIRSRIFQLLSLQALPNLTAEESRDLHNLTKEVQISLKAFQTDVNPEQTYSGLCFFPVELNILRLTGGVGDSSHSETSSQIIQQAVDLVCYDESLPILRFIPYQHALWASEGNKLRMPAILQIQKLWLETIWKADPLLDTQGPSTFLRPFLLNITHSKCDWNQIRLADLEKYRNSLLSHQRLTKFLFGIQMSRSDQLTGFLVQSILLLLSCFISTSESSLFQDAISISRRADIGSANSVKQLLHLMDQLGNPHFNSAPVASLRSALARVANPTTKEGSQLLALGHCWIAFSRLAIDLYVPDAPIDPYAIHQCTDDFWQSREDILMSQIQRHKLLENRLTGDSRNKVTEFLEAELVPIRERLSSVSISLRGRKRDIRSLHAYWSEISQFMNQVISSKLDSLLTASSSNAHSTSLQEGVFQESITGFCQRLHTAYPGYNDITSPFSWSLYHMKFGIRLAIDANKMSASTLTSLAEALVAFPTILCSEALTVRHETLRDFTASPFSLIALSLQAIAFEVSAGVTLRGVLPFLTQAYDQAVNLWLADRIREGELEKNASSLYRNNASITDEEQEQRELMELFPDFELPLDNNIDFRMSDSGHNKLVDASHCLLLFQIHHHLMSPCVSPKLEGQFQDARRDSLRSLLVSHTSLISCSLDMSSLHHQYSMLLDRIANVREDPEKKDSSYNFYHDTNVEEVDRATKVVRALRGRLHELILEWPDQMVLQHLRDRCETLLSLHINSSVAHVLAFVEQLLLQSEDWEMYANRQNSLSSHRHELISLIVRWRRLELSCWSGLLETEARKFSQGASDWWFQLYEAFVRGYNAAINDDDDDMSIVDRYLDGLVPLLDNFLAGSPIGQFLSRMQLLEDFEGYIDRLASNKSTSEAALLGRLTCILHNTRVYHTQFIPAISAHLAEKRDVVEKEIQGFIKLASWKDINVHALKQSAKRTHHQLYKSIRKFREILRQPASTFLHPAQAGGAEQKTNHEPLSRHLPMHDHVPSGSFPEVISVHPRPPHLANLGRTFSKFNELVAHNSNSSLTSFIPTKIDELAVKIIVGSTELSQESVPSSLSKEKRRNHLKVLFVRKKKAFSDLLRELTRVGISANVKPEVLRKQEDKRQMMEQPILPLTFDGMVFDEKGEMYFHRLVGLLPELRSMAAGHHGDITTRDLQRGILLLESGVSMALKSRSSLSYMLSFREQVHSSCRRFRSIRSSSSVFFCGSDLPDRVSWVNDTAQRIQSALREVLEAVSMHDDMDDVDSIKENIKSSALEVVTESCQHLSTVYDKVCLTPVFVLLEDERSVLNSVIGSMRSISGQLRTWSDVQPRLLHLVGPLMVWLDKLIWPDFDSSQKFTVSSLHEHVDEVIEIFLLAVQSIHKLSTKPDSMEGDPETSDNFIKDGLREIESINASLHLEKVLKQLNTILNDCSSAPEHDVKDAVARLLPFLERYLNLVDDQLLNHGRWTGAMFKLDYILCSVLKTVATNGFCKPPETETDGEDEGGAEVGDGVGLGEGTGNVDVSKEIEDESQVEGLQDEGTENEQRDKNQGDENAIEMSEDVGGDLEDVDDKEVEEDDQSESGSEADLEERAEHLEDNDPSALDEKLWGDESGPEESKGSEDKTHEDHSKEESKTSDVVAKEKPQKKDGKAKEKDHPEEQESESQEISEEPETEDPSTSGEPMEEHIDEADTLDLPENMNFGEEPKMQSPQLEDQESDAGQFPDEIREEEGMDSDDVPDKQNDTPEGEDEDMDEDKNEETIEAERVEDQPPDENAREKPMSTQPDLHSGDGKKDGIPESGTSGAGVEPEEGDPGVQGLGDQTSGESDMQEKAASDSQEIPAEGISDASRGNDGKGPAASQTGKDSAPAPTAQLSTNPLRSLGDTLKEVRRNLSQILESSEEREEAGRPPTEPKESQQLQYIRPDEDDEIMQALGAAGDDQAAKLSDLKLVDDEQPPDDSTPIEVHEPAMPERMPGPTPPTAKQLDANTAINLSVEGGLNQDDVRSQDPTKTSSIDPSTLPLDKDAQMSEDHTQEDIEARLKEWQAQGQPEQGAENIWRLYESLTHDLSYALCEQLRLILEPTQATRLKGDYRTGKRLNMKKIIPYIASEYTKDKIWLRRTRPSQREYQVLISFDDSRSMAESHSIHLAYQTLALVSKALSRLEVGDVAIAKFGKTVDVLHGFGGGLFTDQAGTSLISSFRFDQKATNVLSLIETSLKILEDGREHRASSSSTAADLWQLQIIISDGICQDHERLRTVLRRAEEQRVMIVFVILDSLHSHVQGSSSSSSSKTDNSILSMQQGVAFTNANGTMEVKMERYLDSFPFEYYVVLRDVEALPDILSGTLKQFFERISED